MAFDLAQYISSGFDTSTIEQTTEGLQEAITTIQANEEMFKAAGSVAPVIWAKEVSLRLDNNFENLGEVRDTQGGQELTGFDIANQWLGGSAQPAASRSAQQALASKPQEVIGSIENELSNLANTFDFSALSPEQAAAKEFELHTTTEKENTSVKKNFLPIFIPPVKI